MITFDEILPKIKQLLEKYSDFINGIDWLVVNRDLNGRVRLVVPDDLRNDGEKIASLSLLSDEMSDSLSPHFHDSHATVIFERDKQFVTDGAHLLKFDDFSNVWLADRFSNESNWAEISDETTNAPRVVFFSIKGGVGRSTSLAATSWSLAQKGLRVLVLDLDLESPGLSSALLPLERQPQFGITDWLVEDLVNNGDSVIDSMIATSPLSHDGEIYIIPAHGIKPGEYISKLGRVWMPKINGSGIKENWSKRLNRLINELENKLSPDVILIDSRSGIDEVASSCVTDIGANLILLFALDGLQTWNGYRILFDHWLISDVSHKIRERLQIVAAMVPDIDGIEYLRSLREHSYDLLSETIYDQIDPPPVDSIGPSGGINMTWRVDEIVEGWNFDSSDESAPHNPWAIQWHRSFAGSLTLHGRLAGIDNVSVQAIFGQLISGIESTLALEKTNE
ncbi:KGGVGR-motif variant AAA ATPase [Pectobacterium polaris]|uniref:KGGVGR-motif variant AAA ATPase n=1 Tax=Pectobacterium polaris TaxID=2042057 RepID=UPI000EA3CFB7|nr:ArsA-related P-loop ATPase [Pectobacterium polaris]RJL21387.1 ParA family protein [Pectobacterium polaris]